MEDSLIMVFVFWFNLLGINLILLGLIIIQIKQKKQIRKINEYFICSPKLNNLTDRVKNIEKILRRIDI